MNLGNKNELETNDIINVTETISSKKECNDIWNGKIKCISLIGKRFGKLVVLDRLPNKNHKTTWLCKCDCGKEKSIIGYSLVRGDTKSCGCNRSLMITSKNKKSPYYWIYTLVKSSAKQTNRICDLTYEDILEFVKIDKCHYCGKNIEWNEYGTKAKYHGYRLDRKDNAVGYTKNNCVVCCELCNRVKLNVFSYDEMLYLGKSIQHILELREAYDKIKETD